MADETPTDRFRLSDEEKERRLALVRAKLEGQLDSRKAGGRSATKALIAAVAVAIAAGFVWVISR